MEKLNIQKHIEYFRRTRESLPQEVHSSYMTLLFFIISGNDILSQTDDLPKDAIIDWVYKQQVTKAPYAGFRANPSAEIQTQTPWDYGSLASTYSALCILKILGDDYSRVAKNQIISSLSQCVLEDGSVVSHYGGIENDMRFVFCACAICYLLDNWDGIDKDRITKFIASCQSYEGSFAISPGLEGHGGATYCALSSLFLMGRIGLLDKEKGSSDTGLYEFSFDSKDKLIEWLVMRQGLGFSGRSGKAPDTCYGYWVGLSLCMLGASEYVNRAENYEFYSECQTVYGGFSKYPGLKRPDFTHSYLGLCAVGILGMDGVKRLFAPIGIDENLF